MSIQQNFPSTRPSLNLNFARSQKLDPRITFTRTSSATRVNSDGLIEVVPANSPRFDFDPISGESLGLLVEEQRTNLLTSSNNFGTDSTHYGITASAAVSPDGATNASKIFEKTTTAFKIYIASFTAVAGTSYCGSVFVKAGERETMFFKMTQGGGAVSNDFAFNMNTGDFTASGTTRGAIYYGNGWWRIYSVITPTVTNGSFQIFLRNDTTGSLNYEGDGSSGFYIYGAQVEQGAFPTSYIPTTNTTVTRTADNARIIGSNFSDFYNPSEGTVYCEANPGTVVAQRVVCDFGANALNRITYLKLSNGNTALFANNNTNTQASIQFGSWNTYGKLCGSYKLNDFAASFNGSAVGIDTDGILPDGVNKMDIGKRADGSTHLNGHIKNITYYSSRLPNDQLITLTK